MARRKQNYPLIEGLEITTLAAEGKANLDDMDDPTVIAELERANQALVDSVQTQTRALLGTVLDQRTVTMKNAFNMNDH